MAPSSRAMKRQRSDMGRRFNRLCDFAVRLGMSFSWVGYFRVIHVLLIRKARRAFRFAGSNDVKWYRAS